MISLYIKKFNTFSKYFRNNAFDKLIVSYYDKCANIDFTTYACPDCKTTDSLKKHGYYIRKVIISSIVNKITILRVKCKECGKTHAILPSFIIPYIQTSLNDALLIINNYESNKGTIINNEYRIIKSYKLWINRLRSVLLSFKDDIIEILLTCINHFKLFFLQNHIGKIINIETTT